MKTIVDDQKNGIKIEYDGKIWLTCSGVRRQISVKHLIAVRNAANDAVSRLRRELSAETNTDLLQKIDGAPVS